MFASERAPVKGAGSRRFASLLRRQIRMHHLANDGAGADDRHLHHDVIETLRASAAAGTPSARGFPPETCRSCRPPAASRYTSGSSCGRLRQVELFVVMLADQLQRFFEHRHHAQAEQIDLDDASCPRNLPCPTARRRGPAWWQAPAERWNPTVPGRSPCRRSAGPDAAADPASPDRASKNFRTRGC